MGKQLIQRISAIGSSFPVHVFSPMDIPGLRLWLKADSLVLNNNDPVSTWADSSGNGNDATQATGINQPLYITNVVNGNPIVRFDGSNDYMDTPALTCARPNTVIICASQTSKTTTGTFHDTYTGARQYSRLTTSGFFDSNTTDSTDHSGAFHVFSAWRDSGTTVTIYVDQSQTGTGTPGGGWDGTSGAIIGTFGVGGGDQLNGDIAEVICYNSALSSADRLSVEGYLKTKYATP